MCAIWDRANGTDWGLFWRQKKQKWEVYNFIKELASTFLLQLVYYLSCKVCLFYSHVKAVTNWQQTDIEQVSTKVSFHLALYVSGLKSCAWTTANGRLNIHFLIADLSTCVSSLCTSFKGKPTIGYTNHKATLAFHFKYELCWSVVWLFHFRQQCYENIYVLYAQVRWHTIKTAFCVTSSSANFHHFLCFFFSCTDLINWIANQSDLSLWLANGDTTSSKKLPMGSD